VLFRRARWRCQACGRWGALEVHHVVKPAQGGSDFNLGQLVALCPRCRAQTDAPYVRGRLVVTPLGDGRFTIEIVPGVDKWMIRALATAEEGECSGSPRTRKKRCWGSGATIPERTARHLVVDMLVSWQVQRTNGGRLVRSQVYRTIASLTFAPRRAPPISSTGRRATGATPSRLC
jgi:hypothetical protein